jgi:hypothetical protein
MSDLKEFQTGAGGDPFNGAVNGTVGATTPATGAFTTLSASSTATLNTLSSSGATITGGSINGTTVGASTASTGAFTSLSASGAFSANGGTTLGDASGDALTINSSAVSIPNGLNFDSNTFVIDATNNRVGVGIASPAYALSVLGSIIDLNGAATYPTIQLRASSNTSTIFSIGRGSSAEGYLATSGNNPIYFSTNATERMRIDGAGNVGIGTSSPAVSGLEISRATGTASPTPAEIRISTTSNGSDWSTTNPWGKISFYSADASRGGAKVQASIQTTAIATDGGVSSFDFFVSDNANGTLFRTLSFQPSGTNNTQTMFYSGGGTERMRLDASGNLGLGVTPSAWQTGMSVLEEINGVSYSRLGYSRNGYFNAGWKYIATDVATSYIQTLGQHQWLIAPSGTAGNAITFTQAMTLDASGNLGIGTSSPAYKLDVSGSVRLKTGNDAVPVIVSAVGDNQGYLRFGSAGGEYSIKAGADYLSMRFLTESTERMRIDSSGNLLVGTTSQYATTGAIVIADKGLNDNIVSYRNTSSAAGQIAFLNTNGKVGEIYTDGSATIYATSSDYRLKENIAPMTGALATVAQLKPVTYKWKADGSDGQGFIAHELQAIIPQAVVWEKDAVNEDGSIKAQGIDTSFLVATLTAAIQELKAEVDALKLQINQ